MLTITIPEVELFNEETNEFQIRESVTLSLEHSLVSISKWEEQWCKPFLKDDKKSKEEMFDYVKCMIVNSSSPYDLVYTDLTHEIVKKISDYINAPKTATTFVEKKVRSNQIVTSELIYYLMISQQIPFECQHWHLNRLLALINVCIIKNGPQRKMSKNEILAKNKQLNDERRRKLSTTG